jgi:putative spermidine/putrescine transport system ATP-binding protein
MTVVLTDSKAGTNGRADGPGASLQLVDITKKYGDVTACDGVSLDIKPGQFVTLLGSSGSGKTTLLRIIAGFLAATSGDVVLNDRTITGTPVHKRNIGMVFQNYALFPHLNVAKNVAFPLAMKKVPRKERPALVAEALEAVHLGGYQHRMARELSGGQQQRVALARAVVGRPRLLLMDEPLGALDRRLRESLQIEILRLSRELGLTVINVTHDQEEALTMSDRIALLADGRLVQCGSPQELYNDPTSSVTATFLGESNLFRGRKVDLHGVACLDLPYGRVLVPPDRHGEVFGADPGEIAVVVRPAAVELRRASDGVPAQDDLSHVPAKVVANIFAGDSRKVVLEAPDGRQLLARPSSRLSDVDAGAEMLLTWPVSASMLVRSGT